MDAYRAELLLLERNADGLLAMPAVARNDVFSAEFFMRPAALYAGWAYQLRGDVTAGRAAFDSAGVRLEARLREFPDDWRAHVSRGLALAGLGRREEALREARWLQQSAIYRKDAFGGPILAQDLAKILAQAGQSEPALDEIERLLKGPSRLSVHTLRLDPRWDSIREHPRFKALLKKYSSRAIDH